MGQLAASGTADFARDVAAAVRALRDRRLHVGKVFLIGYSQGIVAQRQPWWLPKTRPWLAWCCWVALANLWSSCTRSGCGLSSTTDWPQPVPPISHS